MANNLHEVAGRTNDILRLAALLRLEQLLGTLGDGHEAPQLGKHAAHGSLLKLDEVHVEVERLDLSVSQV